MLTVCFMAGVLALIRTRADLNSVDYYGKSALVLACDNGHRDISLDLIGAGAAMNLHNNFGCKSLMNDIHNDHMKIVAAIIKEGVGPERVCNASSQQSPDFSNASIENDMHAAVVLHQAIHQW